MIDFAFLIDGVYKNIQEINNMKCISVTHSPPKIQFNNLAYDTDDGERETGNNVFKSFEIEAKFLAEHKNRFDRALIESEFYNELSKRKSYYIMHELMPGKQYRVQLEDVDIEEQALDGTLFVVKFNVFQARSESIETTSDEQDIEIQKWQFSQGLIPIDYKYQFKQNNFIIWNLGDFTIDPRRKHLLRIKLQGQSDGNAIITNQTTGENFVYNKSIETTKGETLLLDGVVPYKNGINCGIDTNGGLLTLVPGENKIRVQNITRVSISFDTRFLYKT